MGEWVSVGCRMRSQSMLNEQHLLNYTSNIRSRLVQKTFTRNGPESGALAQDGVLRKRLCSSRPG